MIPTDNDDRRNFHRILFDAPATLGFEDHKYDTRLIDISLNGALLEMPADFSPVMEQRVELNIQLSEQAFIDMQAQVAHIAGQQLGLHCIHIDMESISHLRRLVELNLADDSLLERELSALG